MQNIDWYYLVPGIEVISGTPGSIDKIVLALFALMVVLFLFCCFTLWKQFKVFKSKRVAIAELVDGTDKQTLAAERVYRIGQQKPVSIYLPAALHPQHDAFDVHLDRLLQGKLMLKDAVVTSEGVAESAMTKALGLS